MKIDFSKNTLVPAIIQDANTHTVLMLGYMNQEALDKTLELKKVTFFSRSKNRLWTKGEESGNELHLVEVKLDCDSDTLLIRVNPSGPVCHKGTDTCWQESNKNKQNTFLDKLEEIITQRISSCTKENSYVKSLFEKGINKIAQKVGEEAVEVIIESKDDDDEKFLDESADLLFHYLILLKYKGYKLSDVSSVLESRHEKKS